MEASLVSVVIPAYNAERYLKPTLESALSQTYQNIEIIVVDDGSTDDTSLIARQFGDSIRFFHQPNQGLSSARNTAIKNSRGTVIALLDSDDLWKPEFLERMMCLLDLNPEAAGVYCGFQYINSKGEVVGMPSLKTVSPEEFHSAMKVEGNWLAPCSVIFRKYLAEDAGFFDETLRAVEDWDMWIRLSENKPFVGLPEALVKYRRHETNMSKDPERMITARDQLMAKLYGASDSDISTWSPSKRQAFIRHYRGGAISFFAFGRMEKSIAYLQKLVDMSPKYACNLYVWRGFVRAFTPEEYQFDDLLHLDTDMVLTKLDELFRAVEHRTECSLRLRNIYLKMRGFAFLALADEMGRARELSQAFTWWKAAIYSYPQMLMERSLWGTLLRSIVTVIVSYTKKTNPSAQNL